MSWSGPLFPYSFDTFSEPRSAEARGQFLDGVLMHLASFSGGIFKDKSCRKDLFIKGSFKDKPSREDIGLPEVWTAKCPFGVDENDILFQNGRFARERLGKSGARQKVCFA